MKSSSFSSLRIVLSRMLNKELITPRLLVTAAIAGCVTGLICSLFEILPSMLDTMRVIWLNALELPLWQDLKQ